MDSNGMHEAFFSIAENPYDIDKLVEESGPQEGVTEEEEEKDGEQDGKEQDMPNEDKV